MPRYRVIAGMLGGARSPEGQVLLPVAGEAIDPACFAHLPGAWERLVESGAVEAMAEPEPAAPVAARDESARAEPVRGRRR